MMETRRFETLVTVHCILPQQDAEGIANHTRPLLSLTYGQFMQTQPLGVLYDQGKTHIGYWLTV